MNAQEIKDALSIDIAVTVSETVVCFRGGTMMQVRDLADALHQLAHYRGWQRRATDEWKPRHDRRWKKRAQDLCVGYNCRFPFSLRGRFEVVGETVEFMPDPAPERDLTELDTEQLVSMLDNVGARWTRFRNDIVTELARRLAARFEGCFPDFTSNEEKLSVLDTEPIWQDVYNRIVGTWQYLTETDKAFREKTIREGGGLCGFGRDLFEMLVASFKKQQQPID